MEADVIVALLLLCLFRGGGCDSRLTALSDAESSSVEPWYYSTFRELQLRISTIPTLKSTEVVGNLLAACWLLVGCLLAACSEVSVWEILNCDRTRSKKCLVVGFIHAEPLQQMEGMVTACVEGEPVRWRFRQQQNFFAIWSKMVRLDPTMMVSTEPKRRPTSMRVSRRQLRFWAQ